MTTTNTKLTEEQFTEAEDKIDALIRASKRGTPERLAAEAVEAEWNAAYALPQRTVDDRTERSAAIAAVAVKHGLVAL